MFYPEISDYVLLRNGKVAKEVLPDLRPVTCSKEFIVKTLPQVDLDSLRPGDKIRLASGRIQTVERIEVDETPDRFRIVTENSCLFYHVTGRQWNSTGSNPFNIVEIIPKIDLYTLKVGDTVKLASGATKEIKSVAYNPILRSVQVVFTTCKSTLPWNYQLDGAEPYFPMDSIVKIIPKPKLDFSMNTVDLTTLKEGDTVHLSDRSAAEVVSIARKMLGTIYVIRLRRFGFNYYCVDGCSLDKDKPSIVRIVDTSTAKERGLEILRQNRGRTLRNRVAMPNGVISFGIDPTALPNVFDDAEVNLQTPTLALEMSPDGRFITPRITVRGTGATAAAVRSKPKLNLYTLEPGAVVTLANGNTKEVLKVDLQPRAHTNHICITLADGVWIYNPDGTRPPGRDSAYDIVGVTTAAILADIKAHKEFAESVDVTAIKRGDRLTHANGKEVIAGGVTARLAAGETYTVWHENGCPIVDVHANGIALRTESHAWSIVKITPKPKPTPLTIGGHIVKPGDVLTRAGGDRIVVNKITPEPCGNWKVWHSAHGGCFFEVDSSGHCHLSPGLTITAVAPNQTATLHPWPKPITTPPTKKDADPIRQVAVLDKDGDWMQEEWWDACDMLAAGEITGWAHTQAWHDAKNKLSDPWN